MSTQTQLRIWFGVILGFLLFASLIGCQPGGASSKARKNPQAQLSTEALSLLSQGQKLLMEQKLDEALQKFQEAVRLSPTAPFAHYWLGRGHFFRQEKDQAEQAFKEVLRLDPGNYQALIMLGKIYTFDRAKLNEAQKCLVEALETSPDNLEAHFSLGKVFALKGEGDKAMAEFQLILARETDFAYYHFELARMHEASSKKEQAQQHYQRALTINPQFAQAQQALQRLAQAPATEVPGERGTAKSNKTSQPVPTPAPK